MHQALVESSLATAVSASAPTGSLAGSTGIEGNPSSDWYRMRHGGGVA